MMKQGYDNPRRCLKKPFAVQEEAVGTVLATDEAPQDVEDKDDDPDEALRKTPFALRVQVRQQRPEIRV